MNYDKESFLAGLSVGRALWRPPESKARLACLVFTGWFSIIPSGKSWDGVLETSTDGVTWTEWNGVDAVVSSGGVLMMRGTGNTTITTVIDQGNTTTHQWNFQGNTPVYCEGNIETLLDWQSVVRGHHPQMANNCFSSLFADFKGLVTPPTLPATILPEGCYSLMFSGCTSLAFLPAIPATTFGKQCCECMFMNCSSLHLSERKTGAYQYAWRIPTSGTATAASWALDLMFDNAGGPFKGTPTINTTYYTDHAPVT